MLSKEITMPPKARITKEDIINTTINLVRQNGMDSINARSIAAAMNSSTQPIFSNFESMEDLEKAVIISTYNHYLNFIKLEVESFDTQTFAIFTEKQYRALESDFNFGGATLKNGYAYARICTSWATESEKVEQLIKAINNL